MQPITSKEMDRFNRIKDQLRDINLNGNHLPDQKKIYHAVDLLFVLIFPAYYGDRSMFRSRERADIAFTDTLKTVRDILAEEVAKCLIYLPNVIETVTLQVLPRLSATTQAIHEMKDAGAAAGCLIDDFLETLPTLRKRLYGDIYSAYVGDPSVHSMDEVIISFPFIFAILSHRIAHELHKRMIPFVPRIVSERAHSVTGIDIHPGAEIGENFFIDHGTGVVIGETTRIGNRVKIYQGVTLGARSFPIDGSGHIIKGIKRHPTIEDDVIIYSGASILGGDTVVGKGSVIGGNVWLTRSVPPYSKVYIKDPELVIQKKAD